MNKIESTVRLGLGARSYDIHIGKGLLDHLGHQCKDAGLAGKVALVSSPPVNDLYGKTAHRSLLEAGFDVHTFLLPDGEAAKSLSQVETLVSGFADAGMERTDVVIALGGGTIGDTAGFAAASYLRGVSLVQVPTTLLAQVDSAIGGKTGVNLEQGKNLVGAIWQPRFVLCDTDLLRSLPIRDVASGLAEVIKYGLISDPSIIDDVAESLQSVLSTPPEVAARLVGRCVQIKSDIVSGDEREGDLRRVLNFGHTFGHALETVTDYGRYLHGEAVALGMMVAMEVSTRVAGIADGDLDPARSLLKQTFPKLSYPYMEFERLAEAMTRDKKVAKGKSIWVLLKGVGQPVCTEVDSLDVVAGAFEAAKEKWASE